ncbi:hypothetical protein EON65_39650 [archaeon]|nr:MAG: hypothetical protein EON65_39650 [archaeon]
MSDLEEMLLRNIAVMNRLDGFDVVIICCSSEKQAEYWQGRLEKGRGSVIPSHAVVLAVEEDWLGGAGNGILKCILNLKMRYSMPHSDICFTYSSWNLVCLPQGLSSGLFEVQQGSSV